MKTSASPLAMALALSLAGHAEAKSKAKPKAPPPAAAPAPQAPKAWSEITASAERRAGLAPVYVDKAQGKIWLELPAPGADGVAGRYIWLTALKTGLGSAPVGLDRHQPGQDQILVFRRVGKTVFAEVENTKFVATGAPADEQKAAEEAFAYSTVWGADVAATAPDGRLLVEISGFLPRAVMSVADSLKNGGEPGFKLVDALSAADPAAVKAFPENLEFEARQTFASDTPGAEVRNIAPEPKQISFVVRHSLVKLPEPGFKLVAFDPRVGTFAGVKLNFAPPLALRPAGDRSAHGRDHQGLGAAGFPARAPGHPDLRKPRRRRPGQHRRAERPGARGADPHPSARRARARPCARLRPQLRGQHPGPHLGEGLSAAAYRAEGPQDRPVRRLRHRQRPLGPVHGRLALRDRRCKRQDHSRDQGRPALRHRRRRAAPGRGPAVGQPLG